jgi:hypothetical protein
MEYDAPVILDDRPPEDGWRFVRTIRDLTEVCRDTGQGREESRLLKSSRVQPMPKQNV